MYLEQIMVGRMAVFAYLIGCPETKKAALIDPAGDEERLVDRAEAQGFEIETVINTHGHADHTCGNQKIKDLTGAKIVIGQADADMLSGPRAQQWAAMGFALSPKPDRLLRHGETIAVGNIEIQARAVPGHSPGSMALYVPGRPGHVFTGDALFVGAIGRTDLPGGSMEMLLNSIKEQILTLPDETVVWPGHHYGPRPSSTVETERRTNPFITDFIVHA